MYNLNLKRTTICLSGFVQARIDLGVSIADPEWVLGGSQEVIIYKIFLPAGTPEAVAETYMGLSLVGDEA